MFFRGNDMQVRFQSASMSPPQHTRDLQDISNWLRIQMGWWSVTDVEPMTVRGPFTEAHASTYWAQPPPGLAMIVLQYWQTESPNPLMCAKYSSIMKSILSRYREHTPAEERRSVATRYGVEVLSCVMILP